MMKNKILKCAAIAGLATGIVAFNSAGRVKGGGSGGEPAVLSVRIPMAQPSKDPGPSVFLGAENGGEKNQYLWADYQVNCAGPFRVYFDFRDNNNYHFLDRVGSDLRLGINESGVEQTLATGKLEDTKTVTPLRIGRHNCKIGVFQAGRLALHAFDDRLQQGAAGWRSGGGQSVEMTAREREDIHFSDDFMIADGRSEQWRAPLTKEPAINIEPAKELKDARETAKPGKHAKEVKEPATGFAVKSLRNPLLSANAFSLMGHGKNVASVTGENWWDSYSYECSLRGPQFKEETNRIGLIFAYQDENNYGLFRWSARRDPENQNAAANPRDNVRSTSKRFVLDTVSATKAAAKDAPKEKDAHNVDKGRRELVLVRNGKETVLREETGGYYPGQWYGMEVRMSYTGVKIIADGNTLMETSHPCLTAGGAGVWCDVPTAADTELAQDPKAANFQINSLWNLMRQNCVLDDVRIYTLDGFTDNFKSEGPLAGGWLAGAGDWSVSAKNSGGDLNVNPGATDSRALAGSRRWAQYAVSADVTPGSGGAGLVFLHRDESNYHFAKVAGNTLKLSRVRNGKMEDLDSAQLTAADLKDGAVKLRAEVRRGHIIVKTGGSSSVETFDPEPGLKGRAGLLAGGGALSKFRNFDLEFIKESEPLVTTNAIFDDETTMSDWTSAAKEWVPAQTPVIVNDKPASLLWHSGQFPGDVQLEIEPREAPGTKYEVALSVAKNGQGSNNGYVFKYKAPAASEAGAKARIEIYRQGELLKADDYKGDPRQISSLSLRRAGKNIVAYVNGMAAATCRDNEPLEGARVAFYTQGIIVKTEAARISSDHCRNEIFSSAPTAWRTAGAAIAEVTNRWQCDPRWSFFGLENDISAGKPAVLWSKALYDGDVTLEFYVANKMEGQRGTPYSYARDINVTIGSDGTDLTKGYTFMWGANNNRNSCILRDGEEVRSIERGIPTSMENHRNWFLYRVEKRGDTVTFRVDRLFAKGDQNELVFKDTQPLKGNRLAIWTYNHCIMISKIRVSGAGGTINESADFEPGKLITPYDTEKKKL